jgi:hypothetical protein
MECVNHRGVVTYTRCNKCETPICPRCMVESPIGMRCRDCARRRSPITQASTAQYVRGTVAALAAAAALGWLSLILFWMGAVYGWLVGEALLRAGGRRRSLGMQMIAGAAALLGALLWYAPGLEHGRPMLLAGVMELLTDPFEWVAISLGVFFAASHVRYI